MTERRRRRRRTGGSRPPASSTWRTTGTSTSSPASTSPGPPNSTAARTSSSSARGRRAYGRPPTAFGGTLCVLLRNDGGTFTDVSEASGIQVHARPQGPGGQVAWCRPLRHRRRRPGRPGRRQRHGAQFPLPQPGGAAVSRRSGSPRGSPSTSPDQARGAMGIDWGDFKNDGSLGLAIGNFANEMTALYVTDDPTSLQFSDLANLYGLGAPGRSPVEVRALLLRLRPRRPPRPAHDQWAPRERDRQGAGDGDLRAVSAALLEHRQDRPRSLRAGRPQNAAPTSSARSSAGAAPTPTSTATATSTSS